ncbi:MAG: 1-(5-phosphoribosyl)-5-[(5-phosphoribosylamino)methylideneamino]imidazole-4-carboxamide isomerase [Candidatus Marinimicrobia bacterium]|nr:1-(5-phosphoribosyl)-5-[(5-phosphoribosylamino)methylideneamino]imidazole-4-carboxamide isomerase [Candidatus Neomarinimicrobiota bacterium]
MQVIPAIDIIDGKCVRLTKGDFSTKKEYSEDPVEVAKDYKKHGIERIHVVDLDGAKRGKPVNLSIMQKIKDATDLFIDFGGGIKKNEDIQNAFQKGADQITAGSIAVKNHNRVSKWLKKYKDRIILGADIKDGFVAIHGWQDITNTNIYNFIDSYLEAGITSVICTDISKDGMLTGPALPLYSKLVQKYPELNIIASGGVSTITDLDKLEETGVYGAIVGKAIYEGRITLEEITDFSN